VSENKILLVPDSATDAPAGQDSEEAEQRIIWERPTEVMAGGQMWRVYAKSEGQLGAVDAALQEWIDAMIRSERRTGKKWRWWWRRRHNVDQELSRVQVLKAELFRAVFADRYDEAKHQTLDAETWLKFTLPEQERILDAYAEMNDGSALLAALIPGLKDDAKKKAALVSAVSPDGTHI